MLLYTLGASAQTVVITDAVLAYFAKHRQLQWHQAEAGGQLFAEVSPTAILIRKATGPRKTDRRTRTTYQGDRRAEQREIQVQHRHNLHYVGDWHTHPTARPVPSARDLATVREIATQSAHSLNALLLIIVGTDSAPEGICAVLNNDREHAILDPNPLEITTAPDRL
jgi:integrative and conjugative element protein (TIGR02256 family)